MKHPSITDFKVRFTHKAMKITVLQNYLHMKHFLMFVVLSLFCFDNYIFAQNKKYDIKPLIYTYLGNEQRNYYGNELPEKLDTVWKIYLGEGISPAYGNPNKVWKGAGWTGQSLFITENGKNIIIQPCFDYNLKKIDAENGEIIWQYKFDDILKGTPTFWENTSEPNPEKRYIIMQGSRMGRYNTVEDEIIPSFRAISYLTGKELWRMNSKKTDCYSRDVDGSPIVVNDTAYLALENGLFTIFNPDVRKAKKAKDGFYYPLIYNEIQYYNDADLATHGNDIVSESSPTVLNGIVYTPAGSGHVYGHSTKQQKTVFDFFTGTDMNGSAPVTDDNCLLISIEKQYTNGPGGVFKLNPSKQGSESVIWYFPVPDTKWLHWEGGIVGSVASNDAYVADSAVHLAAFTDVSGYFYIIDTKEIDPTRKALGPDSLTWYPTPKLVFREKLIPAISTPILIHDKVLVPTDAGIFLYKIDINDSKLTLLDSIPNFETDSTPISIDGRVYVAVKNGYYYCFGKK